MLQVFESELQFERVAFAVAVADLLPLTRTRFHELWPCGREI